jgi:hypothetical protein
VCLAARHLETIGVPTLCLGSALDIFEAGRPPRAVFVDYPLGHSAGKPFDRADQLRIVRAALQAFEAVLAPGTIVQLPGAWDTAGAWRAAAMRADAGDTRMPRDTTPRYQHEADRLLAEGRAQPA